MLRRQRSVVLSDLFFHFFGKKGLFNEYVLFDFQFYYQKDYSMYKTEHFLIVCLVHCWVQWVLTHFAVS